MGSLDDDPEFRIVGGYRYVLAPSSPAIDAGEGAYDSVAWCALVLIYCGVNESTADLGAFGGQTADRWVGRAERSGGAPAPAP